MVTIGYTAMLIGAIDPMEGAFIILPGSGLVLLGTYLSRSERWLVLYRFWIFLMITIGVAAMLGFTILGGIGGTTDYSLWWGLLFLPYPIAWSVGIWGPDSPRWVLWLGIGAGVWYLVILVMTQYFTFAAEADVGTIVGILTGIIGALTISGCIYRLRNRNA